MTAHDRGRWTLPVRRRCPGPRCLTDIPRDRDLCHFSSSTVLEQKGGVIAIVGSRRYKPRALIDGILDRLEARHPSGLTVVSGGEPTGVDTTVEEACRDRGYHFCMDDPDGITHLSLPRHMAVLRPENGSARAKFARNSKVVRHVTEVIALFGPGPKSPGTSDTVAKARKAGLTVHEHHDGKWA